MARPTTRSVVREEIASLTPALAEAIAKILGAQPSAVVARTVAAPTMQPMARKAPAAEMTLKRESAVDGVVRVRVEKAPEGGYADRVTVVPANRADQPRPSIRGFSAAQVEEILAANVNVYFFRASDDVSCKPVKQVRDTLIAAGFGFTTKAGARWYGAAAKLPSMFKDAIERA